MLNGIARTVGFSRLNYVLISIRHAKSGVRILNPSAAMYPVKGRCVDEKPAKMKLEAGKQYSWCSCGLSAQQPWCDGSHKAEGVTTLRPVRFEVEKSDVYNMCNCKATNDRPFCDGSHKDTSKRRYKGPPQLNAYDESPVYKGVAYDLGYKPKQGRWHF